MFGGEFEFPLVETGAAGGDLEKLGELLREDAFAAHAFAPLAVVEFAAVQRHETVDDAFLFGRRMVVEPLDENVFHGKRQAQENVTGALRTCGGGGSQDCGHLVVGETGDDGSNHDAGGNSGGAEFADRVQSRRGAGGARFEFAGKIGVEGGHGHVHGDAVETCELAEDIEVARDQCVFRDDENRVAQLGADFEALTREAKLALGGLVAVGGTAHRDGLRLPAGRGQLVAEQFGRAEFNEDLRFEIEAAAPAEVFVVGAGETVGATVYYMRYAPFIITQITD